MPDVMNNDQMKYFYELYETLPRGGPGNNACTRKAFSLIKGLPVNPKVLDVGCGPGQQTLELARSSKGEIIALDNYQPFLDKLNYAAQKQGLSSYIKTIKKDMRELDFPPESFDLIWAEGALYQMGFENGLKKCRELLKKKGALAVTELVWLKPAPTPVAVEWAKEYPDIKNISDNLDLFTNNGYQLIGHFTLPVSAWLEDYYAPLQKRLDELRAKYRHNTTAKAVFDASQAEINNFKKCSDYVGYEFLIAQK